MLWTPPVCLTVHYNGRTLLSNVPLLNNSIAYSLSVKSWSRRSVAAAAVAVVTGSGVSGRIIIQLLLKFFNIGRQGH